MHLEQMVSEELLTNGQKYGVSFMGVPKSGVMNSFRTHNWFDSGIFVLMIYASQGRIHISNYTS